MGNHIHKMLKVRHGDLSDRIEATNLGKDTDLNLFMSVDENIVVDGNGNNCFTKLSTFNNTKEENVSMCFNRIPASLC